MKKILIIIFKINFSIEYIYFKNNSILCLLVYILLFIIESITKIHYYFNRIKLLFKSTLWKIRNLFTIEIT